MESYVCKRSVYNLIADMMRTRHLKVWSLRQRKDDGPVCTFRDFLAPLLLNLSYKVIIFAARRGQVFYMRSFTPVQLGRCCVRKAKTRGLFVSPSSPPTLQRGGGLSSALSAENKTN